MPTRTDETSVDTLVVAASGESVSNECFPSDRGAGVDCSATTDS